MADHVLHVVFHHRVGGEGDRVGFNATCSACDLKARVEIAPASSAQSLIDTLAAEHRKQMGKVDG